MCEVRRRVAYTSLAPQRERLAIPDSRPSGLGQKKHRRRIESHERIVPDMLGLFPGKL